MMKMKKLLVLGAIVGCMSVSTVSAFASDTSSYKQTCTTTVTDPNGKVISHTSKTTESKYPAGSCGREAEDGKEHAVVFTLENQSGEDVTAVLICKTGEKEWNNQFSEGQVLHDGEALNDAYKLPYNSKTLKYDIGIKDANGDVIDFGSFDISKLDKNGFTIVLVKKANGIHATISGKYIKN